MNEKWFKIEQTLEDSGMRYKLGSATEEALIEFWTDTAGQDIPIEFEYDGTPEDFVSKFAEAADSYDVDDEVELYVDMRGQHGVPNTVRELLDDCQEAKDTLMVLSYKLYRAIA